MLLEGSSFPAVKPDVKLRKKLAKKTIEELYKELKERDPRRAKTIDHHNKVRLIRALEIIETLGKVPTPTIYPVKSSSACPQDAEFHRADNLRPTTCFIIALNPSKQVLQGNIRKRLEKRLKQGMIREIKKLRKDGLSWKRLESFGLEYKNVALFLQKKITREQMKGNILQESWHYAKRQLTWLRRWEKQGTKIYWASSPLEAKKIITDVFLRSPRK